MSNVGIKGEYQVMVLDAQGNVKEDTGWFSNLLLDNFFFRLSQSEISWRTDNSETLRVGSGTTTPTATQTTLVNLMASTTNKSTTTSARFTNAEGKECQTRESRFTFTLGSVVGTISEVGWQNGTTANIVHSRALITDVNGNPTSITLTAQDQLVIVYKLTLVDMFKEGSGTIQLNGNNYNWISRRSTNAGSEGNVYGSWFASLLRGFGFWIPTVRAGDVTFGGHGVSTSGGTILSAPSESTLVNTSAISPAGTAIIRSTISFGINNGNDAAGIKTISSESNPTLVSWKYEFTPAIPKTNQQVLNLTFEYTISRL